MHLGRLSIIDLLATYRPLSPPTEMSGWAIPEEGFVQALFSRTRLLTAFGEPVCSLWNRLRWDG